MQFFLVALSLLSVAPALQTQEAPARRAEQLTPPKELFVIERVVDPDTLHIQRNGVLEKLRLVSVDSEEKASTYTGDASKPSTAFGEDSAQWAARFFKDLAQPGEPSRVGIEFPSGREERDVYGRLLCYVILPDGRNFNLMLVEIGKSPYFNKYGNDLKLHAAFVEAQRAARAKQIGIWDPRVNQPQTAGAPSARRPYAQLLPWWDARAEAVDAYRAAVEARPEHVAAADAPQELTRALATSQKGERVRVFGSINKFFDEDDGSWTVLLRTGDKQPAVRVKVAATERQRFAALELANTTKEFRQNYLWFEGHLEQGARGFDMRCSDPAAIALAGPEPKLPEKP